MRKRIIPIVTGIIASFLMALILIDIDAFEKIYDFSRQHEEWELDEIILTTVGISFGLIIALWISTLQQKKEIQEASRAKTEFLASMSHELRTPLNAILGFAELLQIDQRSPLNDQNKTHVDSIVHAGQYLLAFVNEILDLSRIEADELTLETEIVPIHGVVAECVEIMKPLADKFGVLISDRTYNVADKPVLVKADQTRLKQALINIISNGVKFNRTDGSVTIRCHESEPGIVRISVSDTGIGLRRVDKEKVFQLFTQLHADPMVAREGNGIGLYIAKNLIERMSGQIGVESEQGVGSTFWVDLPSVQSDQSKTIADIRHHD